MAQQNDFTPQNECDVELFALACRLYRLDPPPAEVHERVIGALLPSWKVCLDGANGAELAKRPAPSPFDQLLGGSKVANRTLPVPGASSKALEEFRRATDPKRPGGAARVSRFLAQRDVVDEVARTGPSGILLKLEQQAGMASVKEDQSTIPSSDDDFFRRAVRLVSEISRRGEVLSEADAQALFFSCALRRSSHLRSANEFVDERDVLTQWTSLLEIVSEGLNDTGWAGLLGAASPELKRILEGVADLAYLQEPLIPLVENEDRGKKQEMIGFSLTRGPATHFIGAICDSCAVESLDEHPNKAFITFSRPEQNSQAIHSFFGGCIVILTKTRGGDPAIVIRGFNPQQRLLKMTSIGGLYDALLTFVVENVAKPLGVSQVLAPNDLISCVSFSNRPLLHLAFKERYRHAAEVVPLSEEHGTTYNNINMSDRCIQVWPPPARH